MLQEGFLHLKRLNYFNTVLNQLVLVWADLSLDFVTHENKQHFIEISKQTVLTSG